MAKIKYEQGNECFINPYNFVPTRPFKREDSNRKKLTIQDSHKGQLYTGYFKCSLVTKTPLAIPDHENKSNAEDDTDSYPFMTVNGKKIIPGSSLRGTFRSIYEAVTNSCMVTDPGADIITGREGVGKPYEPGVLMKDSNGNWQLYQADRIPLVVKDAWHKPIGQKSQKDFWRFSNEHAEWDGTISMHQNGNGYSWGDSVWVKVDKDASYFKTNPKKDKTYPVWKSTISDIKPSDGRKKPQFPYKAGYLFVGEAIDSKHAESVFIIKKENGNQLIVPGFNRDKMPIYLERLHAILEDYNNSSINRNLEPTDENTKQHYGYRKFKEVYQAADQGRGALPLWYQVTDGKLELSLAQIGRTAYENTLSRLQNFRTPCKSREDVCEACALFGMVGDECIGSRVRFTDALCDKDQGIIRSNNVRLQKEMDGAPRYAGVLLKELGSPKMTYRSFYVKGGKSYDASDAAIRGRKFYWHIPAATKESDKDEVYTHAEKDASRTARYELLKPGSLFTFKVYYDGITEEQRRKLAWTLTLGENDGKKYCIKIGHGKPLGLGSAKVTIVERSERDYSNGEYTVDDSISQVATWIDQENGLLENLDSYKALRRMAQYDAVSVADKDREEKSQDEIRVKYPYIDNPEAAGDDANAAASHQWFSQNNFQNRKTPENAVLPEVNEKGLPILKSYHIKAENAKMGNGRNDTIARVTDIRGTIIKIKEEATETDGIVFSTKIRPQYPIPTVGDRIKVRYAYDGNRGDRIYYYNGKVEK